MKYCFSTLLVILTTLSLSFADDDKRQIEGSLEPGDKNFEDGTLIDTYQVPLEAGQRLTAKIRSDDFESSLILATPDGKFTDQQALTRKGGRASAVKWMGGVDEGSYSLIVAAQKPGEGGKYTLEVYTSLASLQAMRGPGGEALGEMTSASEGDAEEPPVSPAKPLTVDVPGLGQVDLPATAFIDKGLFQSFGQKEPQEDNQDLIHATGSPDGKHYVTGKGGEATWKFTDNVLLDREGPDLLIWQSDGNETFEVWVSSDGRGYTNLGEYSGNGVIPVDLNGKFDSGEELILVKLIDTSLESNAYPGPDIDAIAAIHGGDAAGALDSDSSEEESASQTFSVGGTEYRIAGDAWVDKVVTDSAHGDPNEAVGPSDSGACVMGKGGSAVWEFTNNRLINGEGPDIMVWDSGPGETWSISISQDNSNWIDLPPLPPEAYRSIMLVDIDDLAPAGEEFRFLRLTDSSSGKGHPGWPGADIKAIAAIHGGDAASALHFETEEGDKVTLEMGVAAFVDESVDVDFTGEKPEANAINPHNAVGPPDYDDSDDEAPTYFSLGAGGHAVWKFTDNSLVNGPGDDLLIFEIGGYEEPVKVEVSVSGRDWTTIGEAAGQTSSIDIGDKAPPETEFFFVRLTDVGKEGGDWPGADIDAIAAIHGNSRKDGGAGFNQAGKLTPPPPSGEGGANAPGMNGQGEASEFRTNDDVKIRIPADGFVDRYNVASKYIAKDEANAIGEPNGSFSYTQEDGSGVWEFADNRLVDDAGIDLAIFSVGGPGGEAYRVEISKDGSSWRKVAEGDGGIHGIDISEGTPTGETWRYVKIVDLSGGKGAFPGPDIDAIGAVNSRSYHPEIVDLISDEYLDPSRSVWKKRDRIDSSDEIGLYGKRMDYYRVEFSESQLAALETIEIKVHIHPNYVSGAAAGFHPAMQVFNDWRDQQVLPLTDPNLVPQMVDGELVLKTGWHKNSIHGPFYLAVFPAATPAPREIPQYTVSVTAKTASGEVAVHTQSEETGMDAESQDGGPPPEQIEVEVLGIYFPEDDGGDSGFIRDNLVELYGTMSINASRVVPSSGQSNTINADGGKAARVLDHSRKDNLKIRVDGWVRTESIATSTANAAPQNELIKKRGEMLGICHERLNLKRCFTVPESCKDGSENFVVSVRSHFTEKDVFEKNDDEWGFSEADVELTKSPVWKTTRAAYFGTVKHEGNDDLPPLHINFVISRPGTFDTR